MKSVDNGEDVNEVEGAGNTPLHCAAYEGWLEGCELLLNLGAKLNASNNAGDRPWHWAKNMGHTEVMEFLEKVRRRAFIGTLLCKSLHAITVILSNF
jgi:ankyrin repeat protein